MSILVSDLMSSPAIKVSPRALALDARSLMERHDVRHLPVVDERGRAVGVLSMRDVELAIDLDRTVGGVRSRLKVEDVMHRELWTIRADEPAADAAARMAEHRIGSLPVVDGVGRVQGMLTASDLLAVARRALLDLPLTPDRGGATGRAAR